MLTLLVVAALAGDVPPFEPVVIDAAAAQKVVYGVCVADVDGDGRDDIVSVTENQVVWYQNPDWTKRVMIEDQTELDNVCIAPHDIDGDGQVDFAVGAGWTKVGTIQWIRRGPTLDDRWSVHAIGVEPSTHRMRWADVLENGKPQLVVSPLNASQGNGARLLAFEIPADPAKDRWPSTVITGMCNRLHNHWHVPFGPEQKLITLTASQEGVWAFWRSDEGEFRKRQIGTGADGGTAETNGAGEVKSGRLKNGGPFVATVEPMHGHMVAVYTADGELEEGDLATRQMLDDSLGQGHAVWTADLDGDGGDEIVVGHREPGSGQVKGPGVYVYSESPGGPTPWTKTVLDDGGMACEDLLCTDIDGDGDQDIIAGGRATKNLKLYRNLRK